MKMVVMRDATHNNLPKRHPWRNLQYILNFTFSRILRKIIRIGIFPSGICVPYQFGSNPREKKGIFSLMTMMVMRDVTHSNLLNPLMTSGSFNICCPRDCVSRHNGGTSVPPLNPSESIVL